MYIVSLKQFDGPLDLLLTLITHAKVDIHDIFVSEITEQYLESMKLVDELDMDSASEFLQMAATLLEIKSRAMLPKPPKPEDENELSPEEALIRQLEEYRQFKEISGRMQELEKQAQEAFYTVFWELDRTSMEAYLAEHPDTLANGWDHIYINEAGFDDEGTSIQSIFGEQVLAIDAKDGVLLLRISGKGYRGVLAVGKDPSLLSIEMASTLGTAGQLSGTIAEAHNGVLAMNANGFLDPNGAGNGGLLAGYTMSNGTAYGDHFSAYAYKRIELHEDNLFYIKDALSPVSEDCTDAAEFTPALIVDGKKIMDDYWTGEQPRACIGQSEKYEILMLVIEGRYPLEGILGTSVNNCSEILLQHKCMQAINLDGGSSAMLWFDGEYVTQSSSSPLRYTGGRPLPNAWVYKKAQ